MLVSIEVTSSTGRRRGESWATVGGNTASRSERVNKGRIVYSPEQPKTGLIHGSDAGRRPDVMPSRNGRSEKLLFPDGLDHSLMVSYPRLTPWASSLFRFASGIRRGAHRFQESLASSQSCPPKPCTRHLRTSVLQLHEETNAVARRLTPGRFQGWLRRQIS